MSLSVVSWRAEWPLIVAHFDGRIPAGFPSPADDYMESPLDLNEYLVSNRAATFLMRVEGDSMRDAGILDGDLLVVDRSIPSVTGSVVVVAVAGEYTVKRLRQTAHGVWLDPENTAYKSLQVRMDDELVVFGVVKHAIHTVR